MTLNTDLEKLQNGSTKNPKPHIISMQTKDSNKSKQKKSEKVKPLGERKKAVIRQKIMVLLGNAGVLSGGMAMALPSVALHQLTNPNEEFHLTSEEGSWFSSINTMACPLGGIIVGYMMDRVGRKNTILVTNLCGLLGWALLALAPLHSDRDAIFAQMLIARFISGIMIGLCLSPVGVYSAEISLPRIRGRLILCTSIAIAAGILFMYLLGYWIRNDWQLIVIISTVYQMISTLCVLPMPESPSWLMQKQRTDKARKSLKYFRGLKKNDQSYYDEFEAELVQIKKIADTSRSTAANESFIEAIKSPEVYKPFLLMVGFFAIQQGSGIVVIVVFAAQIAGSAGVSMDPLLVAVFVGVARIITTFFMSSIFERWGRRPAGMISAAGMTACMMLLAASGWFPIVMEHASFLPALCIVLHIVFSTMGLLTLPFFMISEVFPQRVRGTASGMTVCFGLLLSFVIIKLYPTMEMGMGTSNLFAFYGGVSLIGVAYIFFFIPETRGRTLQEIEEYFRSGRKVSNAEVAMRAAVLSSEPDGEVEMKEMFIKAATDYDAEKMESNSNFLHR